MRRIRILAGAMLLAALPAGLLAQASASTDVKTVVPDTTDAAMVSLLQKSHTAEIEAGRNALATTQNEDVRKFAQKLVDDHTKALEKLTAISGRMGVMASAPPAPDMAPAPSPAARDTTLPPPSAGMGAMGDSAAKTSPNSPASDKQFIDAMVVNHQQLLGKLPEEGRGVRDKELRTYVGEVRKSVQRHFTMAREIQTKMGGRTK